MQRTPLERLQNHHFQRPGKEVSRLLVGHESPFSKRHIPNRHRVKQCRVSVKNILRYGSFTVTGVVPGRYTLLAIENGWDLEWTKPETLSKFMAQGETVTVEMKGNHSVSGQRAGAAGTHRRRTQLTHIMGELNWWRR